MNFRIAAFSTLAVAASVILTGCCGSVYESKFDVGKPNGKLTVTKAAGKIKLDGVLDEKEWAGAVVHEMFPAYRYNSPATTPAKVFANMSSRKKTVDPFQGGNVRFMYDDKNLYIGAKLKDVDVMQYGNDDQSHFYGTGDTLEIFLKPANAPSYWECYATPNSGKTSLFFETRGYPIHKDRNKLMPGMKVAAKVQGTICNYKDKDEGWTVEIILPLEQLAKTGCPFKPGEPWTILVARYNYTYNSIEANPQFSTYPELPVVNYHHLEYYSDVEWK